MVSKTIDIFSPREEVVDADEIEFLNSRGNSLTVRIMVSKTIDKGSSPFFPENIIRLLPIGFSKWRSDREVKGDRL